MLWNFFFQYYLSQLHIKSWDNLWVHHVDWKLFQKCYYIRSSLKAWKLRGSKFAFYLIFVSMWIDFWELWSKYNVILVSKYNNYMLITRADFHYWSRFPITLGWWKSYGFLIMNLDYSLCFHLLSGRGWQLVWVRNWVLTCLVERGQIFVYQIWFLARSIFGELVWQFLRQPQAALKNSNWMNTPCALCITHQMHQNTWNGIMIFK